MLNTQSVSLRFLPPTQVIEPKEDDIDIEVNDSYSLAVTGSIGNGKKPRWADLVEDSELKKTYDINESSKILERIRMISGGEGENCILLPRNIADDFKFLHDRFLVACKATGMSIQLDQGSTLNLSYKNVWSSDEQMSRIAIESIRNDRGNAHLGIKILTGLARSLEVIIAPEEAESVGREVFNLWALSLVTVYCEIEHGLPASTTKDLWKLKTDIREYVISKIVTLVGGLTAARQLIIGATILHRKLIRDVLKNQGHPLYQYFKKIGFEYMKTFLCKGKDLFLRNLKKETRKEKRVSNEAGSNRKTMTEVIVKGVLRPTLPLEPLLPEERSAVAIINRALAEIEDTSAIDFQGGNLREWISRIQSWIDKLYRLTSVASRTIKDRKAIIRAKIQYHRLSQLESNPKKGLNPQSKATPSEWTLCSSTLLSEEKGVWTRDLSQALGTLLGFDPKIGQEPMWSTATVKEVLRRHF